MPYRNNAELPGYLRDLLPQHAQDIFREAFNHAWDEYAEPEERRDESDSRDEVANKVAWAAVKRKYERVGDKWCEKD